jgi:hypothetical protein
LIDEWRVRTFDLAALLATEPADDVH